MHEKTVLRGSGSGRRGCRRDALLPLYERQRPTPDRELQTSDHRRSELDPFITGCGRTSELLDAINVDNAGSRLVLGRLNEPRESR